jgi:hypothetical protein
MEVLCVTTVEVVSQGMRLSFGGHWPERSRSGRLARPALRTIDVADAQHRRRVGRRLTSAVWPDGSGETFRLQP